MEEILPGFEIVHLIGDALQGAKEMVKGGDLHLGNTANIELDFPRTNLMNEIFGPGYSIDVLYIDKNYKLVTHTLVDRPSVAVLIDRNGLTNLWSELAKDYRKATGEDPEDGTEMALINEILTTKYGPGCSGNISLLSHLKIAAFSIAV